MDGNGVNLETRDAKITPDAPVLLVWKAYAVIFHLWHLAKFGTQRQMPNSGKFFIQPVGAIYLGYPSQFPTMDPHFQLPRVPFNHS